MEIENLEKKLNGEIPVTREELIELIDSWGRVGNLNGGECYDLSKLDVSEITNLDNVFAYSLFDGDVSNWNTINVTSMNSMCYEARKFNSPLPWNTPNLKSARGMLSFASRFEQAINFDVSNLRDYNSMLHSHAFIKKFNDNEVISNPKEWIEENREKMKILSISETKKSELDSLFDEIENSLNNDANQHRANKQSL